jgi:bacteriocin biosynthesis cyclodehydratase domain-containing protein
MSNRPSDGEKRLPDSAPAGINESDPRRLVALPLQLIETTDGVVVRRGSFQLLVGGEHSADAVARVVGGLSGDGATVDEVCDRFAAPDRPAVKELVAELVKRQFVVPTDDACRTTAPETPLEVFYWHFGASAAEIHTRLSQVRVAVVGVNYISRQLVQSLVTTGFTNVDVVDHPLLRNLSLFDGATRVSASGWANGVQPVGHDDWARGPEPAPFDCLVATSDFGGLRLLREWNHLCVQNGRHFLPVVLQDMVGYVGPSVIPGETACFECFLSRMDSNRSGDPHGYVAEMRAFEGQHVAAFHPSMASILGDIATVELTKFYSRRLPLWKVGVVMEVNLLAGRIDARKVLRVPRCRACSSLLRRSSSSMVEGALTSQVVEH